MKTPANLTQQDFDKIKAAVQKAEAKVSGEIVPVLVTRSHQYGSSKYKYALLLAFISFLLIIAGDRFITNFDIYDPLYYFSIVFGFAIVGFLIPVIIPSLATALATVKEKQHAASQKAETIFLEHEVFNTRQRTGILIFVSFEEHQVIVMADSGINQKVEQESWDELVNGLAQSIKNKQIVAGLESAIRQSAKILLEHGFEKGADDKNELSDNLITDK